MLIARGQRIMGLFFLLLIGVSVVSYLMLRHTARLRFAVAIHALPEAPDGRLPADRPFVVRIEKASAGRSPYRAAALLLGGDGRPLSPPRLLTVHPGPGGRPMEEAAFPPLGQVPPQRLIGAVVMRLPDPTPAALDRVVRAAGEGGPMHMVFSRIQTTCQDLGGFAEIVMSEVRAP